MNLFHIPQCSIQDRNVHISVLNGALLDVEQVHSGICEIGLSFIHDPTPMTKLSIKLGYGWVIASHREQQLWLFTSPCFRLRKTRLVNEIPDMNNKCCSTDILKFNHKRRVQKTTQGNTYNTEVSNGCQGSSIHLQIDCFLGVCSDLHQRKHQRSTSPTLWEGESTGRFPSQTASNAEYTKTTFPCHDVIMTKILRRPSWRLELPVNGVFVQQFGETDN